MRRAKPGDVLRVPLPDGQFGYLHYVMFDDDFYKAGSLVVALDRITTEPLDSAEPLSGIDWLFGPVYVGIWAGQKMEGWKLIGRLPVTPFEMPSFRYPADDLRPGKKTSWRIISPKGDFYVGERPQEYRNLEMFSGESIWSIAERIATGKSKKDLLY